MPIFVIPAKAGIQRACRPMKSKSLNLGNNNSNAMRRKQAIFTASGTATINDSTGYMRQTT